ncbi:dTDP-4-dehydrorhamnose reductase [Alicyclobacillus tolerans]|uniref:dTDP-4-dehydrorhamnose reductase n=1 Tax=Alicyclobacillus tolerans TaxID=90970 RepID=UPI001EFF633F|nr:dTDP-4-dehydrorhamnose reductase [Alicyclobacillus tolerans]MCF8565018.1 dTDP-4-dehydrorhamnose reductase [Alicyclobacillus tolerans]
MKVLVTGANGQLGHDLVKILSPEHEVIGFGRDQMDVCDLASVKHTMESVVPDVVVHAAAYTAVDRAETEIDEAFRVNAVGSRNVAVAAEEVKARVCYISTDYVFDGTLDGPYREYDQVGPTSVYGQSKLAGEVLTQTLCSRYFIVRTSWVFGAHGGNFVKTMLKLGQGRSSLQVVDDQTGCPTYTVDLARFIGDLISTEKYGVYHASNSEACTWFEFAKAIFEEAGQSVLVDPCTTQEFPRPAPRPRNSVLDHLAMRTNGFVKMPAWRDALQRFLAEYLSK